MDIHFDKNPSRLVQLINKKKDTDLKMHKLVYGTEHKFICVPTNQTGIKEFGNAIDMTSLNYSLTAQNIIDRVGVDKWKAVFTFSFVRNPWEKVVAHYLYQCKYRLALRQYPISFEKWVLSTYVPDWQYFMHNNPINFLPQFDKLSDKKGDIAVDYIGRFESFHSDMQFILKKLDLKLPKVLNIKNSKNAYQAYYNKQKKKVV